MGGLHIIIEIAMWSTFEDYLAGSGWAAALLTHAGVASSGTCSR